MSGPGALERARESLRRGAWSDAYAYLVAADGEASLQIEDVEQLAVAAHLIGKDEESAGAWVRAYHEYVRLQDTPRATRCAFWLGFTFRLNGEGARSEGWIARGQRLLDEQGLDCVERGYLIVPASVQKLHTGESATALKDFEEVARVANRFGDRELAVISQLGCGQALVQIGKTREGMRLLDEVMVAVTAGELSPILAGTAYCAVIGTCQGVFDQRRAREWTSALTAWCERQPDVIPYRRECLIHRAEIMQLHGAWPDALEEARRACELMSQAAGQPQIGSAIYQQAEIHRLRGELSEAEDAYRQAHQHGRNPQPGLALLRLAQGKVDAAVAAISLALDETHERLERSKLLSAFIEIMLAAGNVARAREAADELAEIAADVDAALLHARSRQALGAVLLAEGDARAALAHLRRSWADWQELEAPYEAARVRVLVAFACRQLGDDDTAAMELDAARWVFQELGAAYDLERISAPASTRAAGPAVTLTERELEVLRLAAAGKTNQGIATELFLSEHTVRRHLQNIFSKLGVSSRAAATAYAYRHNLL